MLKEGFIVGQLLEDLQAEIDSGGPGKTWYRVFQEKLKSIAGTWPPKDFVQFEPDAINPTRWKYSEKLDLAQKLFEEQILAPERKVKVISFVLSGDSDGSIKRNISKVVNQFLNEITKICGVNEQLEPTNNKCYPCEYYNLIWDAEFKKCKLKDKLLTIIEDTEGNILGYT